MVDILVVIVEVKKSNIFLVGICNVIGFILIWYCVFMIMIYVGFEVGVVLIKVFVM